MEKAVKFTREGEGHYSKHIMN